MKKVKFFLAGEKGYRCLKAVLNDSECRSKIEAVVSARDSGVTDDRVEDIKGLCEAHSVPFEIKGASYGSESATHLIAIGWRWLINDVRPLVIFHDSLLPRYRGFNPLVTALINGDDIIGVTAIHATGEFDQGDILLQQAVSITYPMKIKKAIDLVTALYEDMLLMLLRTDDAFAHRVPQAEERASYSLWRNTDDYFVDWSVDSQYIGRMVDAVGEPYLGACTDYHGKLIRLREVTVIDDLVIENRCAGKILRIRDNRPEVVCGSGMVRVDEAVYDGTNEQVVFDRLRVRLR